MSSKDKQKQIFEDAWLGLGDLSLFSEGDEFSGESSSLIYDEAF
jgi:hypothetical protein